MSLVLECQDLCLGAPDGRRLVDHLDLQVGAGQRVAFLGPSGAGKTSLLRAVLGDLPDTFSRTGTIRLDGHEHRDHDPATRRRVRGRLAYLPQDAGASLTPTMGLGALLGEVAPQRGRQARAAVRQVLTQVGLPSDPTFLARRPWQLSGGQQRRLALARALVLQRPLLVLDEPTAGLDPVARRQVLDVLESLSQDLECALVMVTHDEQAARVLGCEIRRLGSQCGSEAPRGRARPPSARGVRPVLVLRDGLLTAPGGGELAREVTLEMWPGEVCALRGASGAGKTTLARVLAGLAPLARGRIELDGVAVLASVRHRTTTQRRRVQYVAQDARSCFNPRRTMGQALKDARPVADPDGLLDLLGLGADLWDRLPSALSGGQCQRLALLRALSVRPDVLLLDEPTSALDSASAQKVLGVIRRCADQGVAVLLVTHDLAVGAARPEKDLVLRGGALTAGVL